MITIKDKTDWLDAVNDCRSSVSKKELTKEPSSEFKQRLIIAEHTPLRMVVIRFKIDQIKSWIATHLVRNIWYKVVSTQRNDRTGEDRDNKPQSAPVTFVGELNGQNLIDTSRKRLCFQAHPETRAIWKELVAKVSEVEPEMAEACVPNCVYRCGCPEFTTCGHWDAFCKWCVVKYSAHPGSFGIQERYKLYHEFLKAH